jgi:hypothetical protein
MPDDPHSTVSQFHLHFVSVSVATEPVLDPLSQARRVRIFRDGNILSGSEPARRLPAPCAHTRVCFAGLAAFAEQRACLTDTYNETTMRYSQLESDNAHCWPITAVVRTICLSCCDLDALADVCLCSAALKHRDASQLWRSVCRAQARSLVPALDARM